MKQNIASVTYRHLTKQTTAQEEQMLVEWLNESEGNRTFFFEMSAIWSAQRTLSSKELDERLGAMMCRLNARIDADEAMKCEAKLKRKNISLRNPMFAKIAATAVAAVIGVVLIISGVMTDFGSRGDANVAKIYQNTSTDILSVKLTDGTVVWLQPNGSLQFTANNRKSERVAKLTGEAFFDVAHNPSKPFVVHTELLNVRVLGTAFNVAATQSQTEVVLQRGSVRLQTPEGNNLVRLHPNQRAVYDAVHDEIEVQDMRADAFVTNRYKLISLKNATIQEIVQSIEKNYGIKIEITNSDTTTRYDLNYLRSSQLNEVFTIVEFLTGQECRVVGRK